jgi:hypothetical protein
MPGMKRRPIEERFADYLVRAGEDECWGWTGPTSQNGYPTLGRGGKGAGQVSARLLAYRWAHGGEPDGEVIVTCGSTSCLNPRHLALRENKPLLTLRHRCDAKVKRGAEDECWLWTAHTTNGYGFLSMGRKRGSVPAHRLAWEMVNGPIPDGVLVRQRCGNRLCCNPAHLFLALNALDSPEVSARTVEHWLRLRG